MHGTDFISDELAQYFQKKFNFEWDVIPTTFADWGEKARIWITAGDMPDMIWADLNQNDYKNWVAQDLLKRLPDNWKQKYPNLVKAYDASPIGPYLEGQVGGTTAVIPNPIFFNKPTSPKLASHGSLFFRKDWAKALGFEIKDTYTLGEVNAMVEKFMAEGSSLPGVTQGRVDTWNLDTNDVVGAYLTSQWADANGFYKDATGKYVWGPDDPKTFELVKGMKDAINRGIVSRNFASFRNDEETQLFYTGQAFATMASGYAEFVYKDYNRFQDTLGLDPFEHIQQAVLIDADGYVQGYDSLNYWSCYYFSPELTDAKMERILTIMNYVASDEGQDIVRLGFEGKDYTRDGNTVTINRPLDANGNFISLYEMYPGSGIYSHMAVCADDFVARNPAIPERYHNTVRTMYATKQRLGVDSGVMKDFNFELTFFDGPNKVKFNTDVGGELVRVCLMDGDLKTNYDNWLRDMRPVVDPVLKELNDAFGK
jgi:putative aldouronate transport system substrate-binding protein